MQPYFMPYAGYFRLCEAADYFVLYDCVQFPRRGWVHRNRLPDATGALHWLTLPLAPAPQQTPIRMLRFHDEADALWASQLRRFPLLGSASASPWRALLEDLSGSVCDYLERLLRQVIDHLGLRCTILRSSQMSLPGTLRGQERILAVAERLGAGCYVNAPGGRALYRAEDFAARGIALRFLADYAGDPSSILARLPREPAAALREEIRSSTVLLS